MSRKAYDLRGPLRRALWIGLAVLAAAALLALFVGGPRAALAAGYGSGIALVNLLLLRWHVGRAERLGSGHASQHIKIFYRCAMERFLVAVLLFAWGIGVWALPPLPLLGGFLAGQAAQLSMPLNSKRYRGWRNV